MVPSRYRWTPHSNARLRQASLCLSRSSRRLARRGENLRRSWRPRCDDELERDDAEGERERDDGDEKSSVLLVWLEGPEVERDVDAAEA